LTALEKKLLEILQARPYLYPERLCW
jgi:hypothetical protein